MRWIYPLAPETEQGPDVLGGKAHGLVMLRRLRLPVPPGFVIGTEACRAFLRHRRFPDGLDDELAAAVAELEAATGRPLAVSVRSGGRESMPGMMTTVLNLPVRQVEPAVAAVFSSWDTPRAQTYRELHGIPDRPRIGRGPRRAGPVLVRGDRGRGWPARGCGTPPAGRAGRPGA
jgi:pyruvate,orthophosphate dikinase